MVKTLMAFSGQFMTGCMTVLVWAPATLMALFALWGLVDVMLYALQRPIAVTVMWGGTALLWIGGYLAVCHCCWRKPAMRRRMVLVGLVCGATAMVLALRELWLRQPEVFAYNPLWVNLYFFGAPLIGCLVLALWQVIGVSDDA